MPTAKFPIPMLMHAACAAALAAPTVTPIWMFHGTVTNPQGLVSHKGAIYGTTAFGGVYDAGTVFQVTSARTVSFYSIDPGADGAYPNSSVAFDDNGAVYASTYRGAGRYHRNTCGSILQVTPPAATGGVWGHAVIYKFPDAEPCVFVDSLVFAHGILYGAAGGGAANYGIIFALTPPASGGSWNFTTLYTFTGGADGSGPTSLLSDAAGNLYGVASSGSVAPGAGTVFELSPPAVPGASWTETTLYSFLGGSDGSSPASVAFGADGALYGVTTAEGPANGCATSPTGCGTVFRLSPPAQTGGAWNESVLYGFPTTDGPPNPGLVVDTGGIIYGTAGSTLFELAPAGGAWTESTLYVFSGHHKGFAPTGVVRHEGSLIVSASLPYGMFQFSPPAASGGSWTESTYVDFSPYSDAKTPFAGLAFDAGGALYGASLNGGAKGIGAVFKLQPPQAAGQPWSNTVIYSFPCDHPCPLGGVTIDKNGALYGTMWAPSIVYQLTPQSASGGGWKQSKVHWLGTGHVGQPLVVDDSGALYGTTLDGGGTYLDGIVFRWTPNGGAWKQSILHTFKGGADGAEPSGLVLHNGALYGVTTRTTYNHGKQQYGTVFQLAPPSAGGSGWTMTVLHRFAGWTRGAKPNGNLTFDASGVLYGTTKSGGGALGCGVIYQLTAPSASGGAWTESTVYDFSQGGCKNGIDPTGIAFNGGSLYATACRRGINKSDGVLIQLVPPVSSGAEWTEASLLKFDGPTQGFCPESLQSNNGALYGVARAGGQAEDGVVFQVNP